MKLAAALMAGGQSRRMGANKALIDINGTPLWRYQANKLHSLSAAEFFISVRKKPQWPLLPGFKYILDAAQDKGPISGLCALLKSMQSTHLLVLGLDMPYVSTTFLEQIRLHIHSSKGVIYEADGFYQPLCAVYPKASLYAAEDTLHSKNHSLQAFIQSLIENSLLDVRQVADSEKCYFKDWDTPDDINQDIP